MALFDWFGGAGQYGAARLWSPRGVPGAGDTARVASGDVTATARSVAATVELGGTDAGAAPALDLRNASVAGLTMLANVPPPPNDASGLTPPQYGTVDVRGHSSIGHIAIGAFSNFSRDPGSHGAQRVSDNLQVNLAARATLATSFDVEDGSTLTVSGGAGSSLHVVDSTMEGGRVVIDAALTGQGTIAMNAGAYIGEGQPSDAGTLELGGPVGAGETVDITIGQLMIDKPLDFAGTIDFRAGGYGDYGAQNATLRGLAASSYSLDDAAHTLTLYDGDAVLDTIKFNNIPASDPFSGQTYSSPLQVVQTAQGVLLAGSYTNTIGDTVIPLHAAAS